MVLVGIRDGIQVRAEFRNRIELMVGFQDGIEVNDGIEVEVGTPEGLIEGGFNGFL